MGREPDPALSYAVDVGNEAHTLGIAGVGSRRATRRPTRSRCWLPKKVCVCVGGSVLRDVEHRDLAPGVVRSAHRAGLRTNHVYPTIGVVTALHGEGDR
jgi:hypothetical protein